MNKIYSVFMLWVYNMDDMTECCLCVTFRRQHPEQVARWIPLRHFPWSYSSFPSIAFAPLSLLMVSINLSRGLPLIVLLRWALTLISSRIHTTAASFSWGICPSVWHSLLILSPSLLSWPQVDLTFERFRFPAPCHRLRAIVCVLSAHLRRVLMYVFENNACVRK